MIFVISRSGFDRHGEAPPIEGAFRRECWVGERRNVSRPEDLPVCTGSDGGADGWYARGRNHSVDEDGLICREVKETLWLISFESAEDVLRFCMDNGPAMVTGPWASEIEGETQEVSGSIEIDHDCYEY